MAVNILMPALSPTMEKGNVAKWLVKVGDMVKSGDIIAEIETDKATMEVEAVDEGILTQILVAAGTQDVPVNAILAVIGEGVAAPAPVAKSSSPLTPLPEGEGNKPTATPSPLGEGKRDKGGEVTSKIFASPLARRIAKDAGLNLATLKGSGPHGRIIERDVLKAKASPPQVTATITPPSDEKIKLNFVPGSYTEIPHDNMRKVIARRLVESKSTIPHFYLQADCDIDALMALREQINKAAPLQDGKPTYKVSVNDFVIKALAVALNRVPDANVSWTESAMLKHTHSDIGVAVSIPGGLITPIVRKAETKTLSAISLEMKDFATRAKARKLKPDEYTGGSSAVSNLGMFGTKNFSAIVNPPHASILAVGAGEQRAVVKNGVLAVATMMSVTLSVDHRAVDGALGAELLAAFKGLIESPIGMLV
jgi:pyruvate dehydrogenase E2 component (dihydrolipoamide acetyltransferase)